MISIFIRCMSNQIDPKSVFVIVPAYNETETIQAVVDELLDKQYTLVLVDDGSSTDLCALLKNRNVFFLRHEINLGQGAALQTGIEFALYKNASYIATFDADGQHNANDLEKLFESLKVSGADIVLGSRFLERSNQSTPILRRATLQLARYINLLFTGLLLTDAHNGLRVMTGRAAKKIQLQENRMAHASEILLQIKKHRLKYIEYPVNISYTKYSKEKGQTAWSGFRIIFDLLLNKIFR